MFLKSLFYALHIHHISPNFLFLHIGFLQFFTIITLKDMQMEGWFKVSALFIHIANYFIVSFYLYQFIRI